MGLSLLSGCVTCATLDSMILYNRPRTRDEVRGLRRRGLRAIIRNYDIFGRLYVLHVRPSYHISAYLRRRADVLTFGAGWIARPADDLTDAGRRADAARGDGCRDAGTRAEASPCADLAGGLGGLLLSDEADRMTTRC